MTTDYITYGGKRYETGVTYGTLSEGQVKFDLASNKFAQTLKYLSKDGSTKIYKTIASGNFKFTGAPSGTIESVSLFGVSIDQGILTESAQSYNFLPNIDISKYLAGYPTITLPDDASSVNYFYTNSKTTSIGRGKFDATPIYTTRTQLGSLKDINYFPDGWWQDPFNFSLSSSGNPTTNPSTSTAIATTLAIDILTGAANTKDIFTFSATPAFGKNKADHITNFVVKGKFKDTLAISKSAYGITASKASLKAVSTDAALTKAFASTSLFVYDKRDGGLYLNADGKTAGFGNNGGLFAILDNKAGLMAGNISLV